MSEMNYVADWKVRQDRVEGEQGLDRIEINGNSLQVVNFNSFGILVEADQPQPEKLDNIKFYSGDYLVSELNLEKTRSFEDTGTGKRFEAFSIVGEPLRVEKIVALRKVNKVIEDSNNYKTKLYSIPEIFRTQTFEARALLLDLKTRVESIEPNPFELYKSEIDEYENVICKEVASHLLEGVATSIEKLGALLNEMTKEERDASIEFFREEVGSFIYDAPYPKRALDKPRGYAGDYEMMISTYRLENRGKNLFAKCLHRLFIEEQAPTAVRNRAVFLEEKIVDVLESNPKAKILSVACGPAMEVDGLITKTPSLLNQGASFHFLDQDEEALQTAQRVLVTQRNRKNLNLDLKFHHQAIKDVIANGLGDEKFDMIYSAGLFDYLTAPVAQFAASRLYEHLNPGGTLVIGNFSKDNPNQYGMVLTMDWKLIYRDTKEMEDMVKHLPGELEIRSEELDINLFSVLKKVG